MKYFIKLFVTTSSLVISFFVNAEIFENWDSGTPELSPISVAGIIWPTYYDVFTNITEDRNRWLVNTHNPICANDLAGPNPCYSMKSGKLFFHGEKGANGDGVLLASKDEFDIQNGMVVEGGFRAYCTNLHGGCWVNIGIYMHEGNYRSIGFKSLGGSTSYFNIWGPDAEAYFDGTYYAKIPLNSSVVHHFKLQYWRINGVWRWDYFLDNNWIAGHNIPDNEFNMGAANFDKARLEIAYGGYQLGVNNGGNGAAAEGYFEALEFHTW